MIEIEESTLNSSFMGPFKSTTGAMGVSTSAMAVSTGAWAEGQCMMPYRPVRGRRAILHDVVSTGAWAEGHIT